MIKVDKLIIEISNLVQELKRTNNSTQEFYQKLLVIVKSADESNIKEILLAINSSAKIKDYGGYDTSQIIAWDKMWEVANTMLKDS